MNHSTLPVRAASPLSSVPPPTAVYKAEGIKFKPVTFSSGGFFPIQDDARSEEAVNMLRSSWATVYPRGTPLKSV